MLFGVVYVGNVVFWIEKFCMGVRYRGVLGRG